MRPSSNTLILKIDYSVRMIVSEWFRTVSRGRNSCVINPLNGMLQIQMNIRIRPPDVLFGKVLSCFVRNLL